MSAENAKKMGRKAYTLEKQADPCVKEERSTKQTEGERIKKKKATWKNID